MHQEWAYHVNNTQNLDVCGQQVITFYTYLTFKSFPVFIKLLLLNVKILLYLGVIHWYVRKLSRKTNISYLLIRTRTCTYQGE